MNIIRTGPTYIAFTVVGVDYDDVEAKANEKIVQFFGDDRQVTLTSFEATEVYSMLGEHDGWRGHVEAYASSIRRPERASK